jgi:uncharacterized delta-60 repeat protein
MDAAGPSVDASADSSAAVGLDAGPPGSIDISFGEGGLTKPTLPGVATAVTVAPDGKIVATGKTSSLALVRYLPDGSPDPAFGTNGVVTNASMRTGTAVTVLPSGDILVGATASNGESAGLIRYASSGVVDTSYGGGFAALGHGLGLPAAVTAIAVAPDGSAFASGYQENQGVIAHLTTNGSLDASFGAGGIVTTTLGSAANGVVLESDRKVVVCGAVFGATRYLPDGGVDTAFGSAGNAAVVGMNAGAVGIGLGLGGGVVLGGDGDDSTGTVFILARLTPAGALDTSFGTGGLHFENFDGGLAGRAYGTKATALAVQADGKPLLLGSTGGLNSHTILARFGTDGKPDTAFGSGGSAYSLSLAANGLALQPDGRILLAGAGQGPQVGAYFEVARLWP